MIVLLNRTKMRMIGIIVRTTVAKQRGYWPFVYTIVNCNT